MCAMDTLIESAAATEPGNSVNEATNNDVTPTQPPCFLCQRQGGVCEEGLEECRNAAEKGETLLNGEGKEERDQVLQKVFNVKVV